MGVSTAQRMATMTTAILHLDNPPGATVGAALARTHKNLSGVRRIEVQLRDAFIAVRFDQERTGLAEIVRAFEDAGSSVSSVAQRAG